MGPEIYRPSDVPAALRSIARVADAVGARKASSACLFAFGNDHRGTIYPAAPHAVPFLAWYVAHGSVWSRLTALEVLADAVRFYDDGHSGSALGERETPAPVRDAFRDAVKNEGRCLLAVIEDPTATEEMCVDAVEVLDDLGCIDDLHALLRNTDLAGRERGHLPGTRSVVFRSVVAQWLREHG